MSPDPSREPTPPRLSAEGVTVTFGAATVLTDVSIEVPAQQVVGVIGANGAGKTTLLDVICGVTEPTAGTLLLDGEPLAHDAREAARRGVARTIQRPELPGGTDVLDHVLGGLQTGPAPRTGFGWLRARARAGHALETDEGLTDRTLQLLRELRLAKCAADPIATLTHAERARVAIARATIVHPRLLLLDEPAAGLGADERLELARLIRSYATRPGRESAVVLVDHHFDLVSEACDTVIVLDQGRVIARGTPDELRADPIVVDAYLGVD